MGLFKLKGLELIIFDLDFTLHNLYQPYPLAKRLLKELHDSGYTIALASYNTLAPSILQYYDLIEYFDVIEYRDLLDPEELLNKDDKKGMLQSILQRTRITNTHTLFFDDDIRNISMARSLGIKSVLVNKHLGLCEEDVLYGMKMFL